MTIAVLLSTRKRPASLRIAVDSILRNSVRDDTIIAVGYDRDDAERPILPDRVRVVEMDRPDALGDKFNALWRSVDADLYIYACDDITYETHGWDQRIVDAAAIFEDKIGVVYAGFVQNAVSHIPIVRAFTRGFVELMGYFCPSIFPYWFDDTWQDEVARMVDRIALTDVSVGLIDGRGKTRRCREIAFWQTYFDSLRSERIKQALRIIDRIDESKTRKEMLYARIPSLCEAFQRIGANLRDPEKAAHYADINGFENEVDGAYARLMAKAQARIAAKAA